MKIKKTFSVTLIALLIALFMGVLFGCSPYDSSGRLKEKISTDGFLPGESLIEDGIYDRGIGSWLSAENGVLYYYGDDKPEGARLPYPCVTRETFHDLISDIVGGKVNKYMMGSNEKRFVFDTRILYEPIVPEGFTLTNASLESGVLTHIDGSVFVFTLVRSQARAGYPLKYEIACRTDIDSEDETDSALFKFFPGYDAFPAPSEEPVPHPKDENQILYTVETTARTYYILENYPMSNEEVLLPGIYAFYQENGIDCCIKGSEFSGDSKEIAEDWFAGFAWKRYDTPLKFPSANSSDS